MVNGYLKDIIDREGGADFLKDVFELAVANADAELSERWLDSVPRDDSSKEALVLMSQLCNLKHERLRQGEKNRGS